MSEQDLIEASPCKLRNGNWGCKTQEPVNIGDTVRIVTRANKQWRAEITQIVWTDDQICICETASENSKSQNSSQSSQAAPDKSGAASQSSSATDAQAATNPPPAPPRSEEPPTDELDTMADRAAEQEDEFDDLMNAIQEFERDQR